MTLYNLTPQDANKLINHCNNDLETLAVMLWDKGKAKTLQSGLSRAKNLSKFAQKV